MNLRAIGCNVESAAVELREKLAFDAAKLAPRSRNCPPATAPRPSSSGPATASRSTSRGPRRTRRSTRRSSPSSSAKFTASRPDDIRPHLYEHADADAVRHLFRVAAGLDSVVIGEAQIAGQVKEAFDAAQKAGATGPLLNVAVPGGARVSKRVRTETGIGQGHVSVSSAAVDFVRQVFDTFTDKTVLVIGAGEMGRLTLNHLQELNPARVLVTNRSPEKAAAVAAECGGQVVPWEQLDDALCRPTSC